MPAAPASWPPTPPSGSGLQLATLTDETKDKLREHLPVTASVQNPVDIIGDATHERYENALRVLLDADEVDGAIVILTPTAMVDILETAEIVPRVAKDTDKPILCSFMGIVDVSEGVRYLEQHAIPNYTFPEEAVSAPWLPWWTSASSCDWRIAEVRRMAADREAAAQIIRRRLADCDPYFMPEQEANDILQCYGFPVIEKPARPD